MFGVYDIRGIWGKELNPNTIKKLAMAISEYVDDNVIGIGKDIRIHSDIISYFFFKYLNKEIINYGIISTPIAHFASVVDDIEMLMITASHNPLPEYNGIKPIHKKGMDYSPSEIRELEKIYNNIKRVPEEKLDLDVKNRFSIIKQYFSAISERIGEIKKIRIAFDPSNGSGFLYLGFLQKYFKVVPINYIPDGRFPSHTPDPSKEDAFIQIKETLKKEKIGYGLVLDGDCDRLGFIYRDEIFKPYQLVYLIAKYYLNPRDKVVLEIMIPYIMDDVLKDMGIKVIRVPTGRNNVKNAAVKNNAKFFAEYSGHFGFKEFYHIDDGLFTFLKTIEIINKNRLNLYTEKIPKVYIKEIDVPINSLGNMENFISYFDPDRIIPTFNPSKTYSIEAYDLRFEGGRILIREAHTEPIYRIRIESTNRNEFDKLLENVKMVLKKFNVNV